MEKNHLLHNMSAPPKTVATFKGLSELENATKAQKKFIPDFPYQPSGNLGMPLRFFLETQWEGCKEDQILKDLGHIPSKDPQRQLIALINARANELVLPVACVVAPFSKFHLCLWPGSLTALAILSKCSDLIWLRSKTPAIHAAIRRGHVSILIPPQWAKNLLPDSHNEISAMY